MVCKSIWSNFFLWCDDGNSGRASPSPGCRAAGCLLLLALFVYRSVGRSLQPARCPISADLSDLSDRQTFAERFSPCLVFRHNSTHSMHTIHTTNTRTTHHISSPTSLDTITSATTTIRTSDATQQWPTLVQLFCKSIWSIFFCDVTTATRREVVQERAPAGFIWRLSVRDNHLRRHIYWVRDQGLGTLAMGITSERAPVALVWTIQVSPIIKERAPADAKTSNSLRN